MKEGKMTYTLFTISKEFWWELYTDNLHLC